MRIISNVSCKNWDTLGTFKAGTPVRFKETFHDKHDADDIFIINAVCSSYRPEDRKYQSKICVTNLRTGQIAYVDNRRHVVFIECSVHLEEVEC